jgi:DNA-binding winged helix-turn-helix (wHTH) protein
MECPTTKIKVDKLLKIIEGPTREKRAFTICSPYKSSLSGLMHSVIDEWIKEENLIEDTLFMWITPGNSESVLEELIEQVNYYVDTKDQVTKLSGWFGVRQCLKSILNSEKYQNIVIVVDRAEVLETGDMKLINALAQINMQFPLSIQFLFLYRGELIKSDDLKQGLGGLYIIFTSNISYWDIGDRESTEYTFKDYFPKVDLKLPENVIENVFDVVGDHVSLAFVIFREFKRNKNIITNVEELLKIDEIRYILLQTWFSISEETQSKLKEDPQYTNEFLLGTGLKKDTGDWFSILFTEFINDFNEKNIYSAIDDIASVLTDQELSLFNLMKDQQGEVITRDDIAKAIWGENWIDKYSDWAITKLISKVRKKIALFNIFDIETITGEGYKLVNYSTKE